MTRLRAFAFLSTACFLGGACSKAPNEPPAATPTASPGATPTASPGASPTLAPTQAYTEGKDYLVLERVMFLDEMGFDRPVEAYSVLLPHGWKSEGGVRRGSIGGCRGELVQSSIKATSADGTMSFEAMPVRSFGWAEDPDMLRLMRPARKRAAVA